MLNLLHFEFGKTIARKKNKTIFGILTAIITFYFISLHFYQNSTDIENQLKREIQLINISIKNADINDSNKEEILTVLTKKRVLLQYLLEANARQDWRQELEIKNKLIDLEFIEVKHGKSTYSYIELKEEKELNEKLLAVNIQPIQKGQGTEAIHLTWNTLTLFFSSLLVFLLLFILIGDMHGYEYDLGTNKLLSSTPYTSNQVKQVKLFVSFLTSFIFLLIMFILPFALGLIGSGHGAFNYPIQYGVGWSTMGVLLSKTFLLLVFIVLFISALIQLLSCFIKNGMLVTFSVIFLLVLYTFLPQLYFDVSIRSWIPFHYFNTSQLIKYGNPFLYKGILILSVSTAVSILISNVLTLQRKL